MENYEFLIKQSLQICKKYEGSGTKFLSGKLQEFFQDDLLRMGYLLATMDGILDYSELGILCRTFNIRGDEYLLREYYWEDVCLKNNFLQRVPKSIMYVISEERKMMKNSFTIFLKDSRILYKAMKQFGYSVITCNSLKLPYQIVALEELSKNVLNAILNAEDMDVYFEEMDIGYTDININKVKTENIDKGTHDDDGDDYNIFRKVSKNTEYYNPYKGNKDFTDYYDVKKSSGNISQELKNTDKKQTESDDKRRYHYESNRVSSLEDNNTQLRELLEEIDGMIGLDGVKREIHNLVNLLQVQKMRQARGLKYPVMSNHLVFTGNPGTGKTTVARKIAKIYRCLGILEKGHLIETDRAGMVAGYMGQTAEKVNELVEKAMGGILFVDEAYTLSNYKMEGDFGQEAIDTLLKIMEDRRDNLVVIVAGYPEPMEKFLDSNPGLRSRFNKHIQFEDYSVSQLNEIFHRMCDSQDYKIAKDAESELLLNIGQMVAGSKENFANAREIRNYFEQVVSRQANRIMEHNDKDMDYLITIEKEDLST